MSLSSFGALFQAVYVGPVKQSLFSRFFEECDRQGVPMAAHEAVIKEWFDYGILQFLDCTKVDQTLAWSTVALLQDFDWDSLGSHDWFSHHHTTGKPSSIRILPPMVRRLADGNEKRMSRLEKIHPIYRKEIVIRGMSLDWANTTWLQYLSKKRDYFGILSFEAHGAFLERCSSSAVSVIDESQASPTQFCLKSD